MGHSLFFNWFGKSVDELKAILETDKNLSEQDKEDIKKAIEMKENEKCYNEV